MLSSVSAPLMASTSGLPGELAHHDESKEMDLDFIDIEFVDEPSDFEDHQYTMAHSTPVQQPRAFITSPKVSTASASNHCRLCRIWEIAFLLPIYLLSHSKLLKKKCLMNIDNSSFYWK